ncbi:MAG: endonuclease MutS2 [Nitrospirae bacterium]|nr:endonuclease MutS2 [Nitrospirota bacterium]
MISNNTLALLEFDRLLEIISRGGHSEISKQAVLDLAPLFTRADIRNRFLLIGDIRRISSQGSLLRLHSFQDLTHLLGRVRPQGALLEAVEISAFVPVLEMALEISTQVSEFEGLRALSELTVSLTGQPELLKTIQKSIDADGHIKDSASPVLAGIRRELRRLEMNIQKKLEEMTRDASLSVFLQDDFITKRAGRWVIPVRMDSKGMVPGVVHDISKSGETAFIEPLAVIHFSNELENLSAEEKAEELRILRTISAEIRSKAGEIAAEFAVIVQLDMLNCIARFADHLHMEVPEIGESNAVRLVHARHPLLALALEKAGSDRKVVPLDIELGGEDTAMVITGSNAGGKTISIKTVGLLLCMALSGMPVPAGPSSSFPLVSSLLVDMGDEQSIESSLSTFSAHVRNIAEILETADANAMVLIDELGTGTDPDEGTALACAVLRELQQKGSLVFATTHLMGIKGFVHRARGMVNASMEFDKKSLTPLYRLRTGEPGQSHALEIARKFGLPAHVVDAARELLGGGKVELDTLMADLNDKRAEYEQLLGDLRRKQGEVEAKVQEAEKRIAEAELKKREMLASAHKEALAVVSDSKRQLRVQLDEIKNKEKKDLQDKIKQVELKQRQLSETLAQYAMDEAGTLSIEDIHIGDQVFVKSLGYDGAVSGIMAKADRVKIISGSKEILVPVSDIRIKKGRALAEKKEMTARQEVHDEMAPSRINLVGTRVDEALSRLEPFLNHAALAGFREVTIIHGYGTGILAKAVREHVTRHPLVKQFRHGEPSEGAGGVTVVTLV